MNRFRLLFLVAAASLASLAMAQAVSTGEYSYQVDGTPAMTGQATHDHLFTQCEYNGQTFINKISFQSDNIQTVWFYLDDDEIYQNEAIQALSPIAYNAAGDLYNEITYNSFQCEIYLPEDIQIVTIADEDYNEVFYHAHMNTCPSLSKVIDNDAGPCGRYCDHCPGWVGRVIAWAGYFMVYDLIGRTTPQCEFWVFKTKADAEAKRAALVALRGEDLVMTNF